MDQEAAQDSPAIAPQASPARPINWEAVRMLAIAVGVREAARQFGIGEEATMKRCQREGWLKNEQVRAVAERSVKERMALSASVRSPAAVIAEEMAGIAIATKLGMARSVAKVAEQMEGMDGLTLFRESQNVKSSVQSAAILHGWDAQTAVPRMKLEVIAGNHEKPAIDIQSEVITPDSWTE